MVSGLKAWLVGDTGREQRTTAGGIWYYSDAPRGSYEDDEEREMAIRNDYESRFRTARPR